LVKAISFVGGDAAGKHIYTRAGGNGKRVHANMGAKSAESFVACPLVLNVHTDHAILMPDANKNHALNAIVGAAFGAAGQRCMALSVCMFVITVLSPGV
jgi:malonate-semialdehyde dehydrogenase (acetylating) / methylmalonate-semialdehyde dehydrogenase